MEKAKSKNVQILLPTDFVCGDKFDKDAKVQAATLEVKLHSKRVKKMLTKLHSKRVKKMLPKLHSKRVKKMLTKLHSKRVYFSGWYP